jgi:hypothetical protein
VTSTGSTTSTPSHGTSSQYKEKLKQALRLDHEQFIRQIAPPQWQFWRTMPKEAHGLAVLAGSDKELAAQVCDAGPHRFQSHLRQAPDHILLPALIEAIDELQSEGIQIGQPFFSRASSPLGGGIPKPYGVLDFSHRAH